MGNNTRRAVWLGAFVCSMLAIAANVHATEGTVGELSSIQTETMILKAKTLRATARAELDARQRAAGLPGHGDLPVAKGVSGAAGRVLGTFLYSNGVEAQGHVGDIILGGYKIVTLSVDKVELSKNGKVFQVGFSTVPPSAGAVAPAPALPGAQGGYTPVLR